MQHYPKALYLAGAMAMAANEAQEAVLREAGHLDWHEDNERTKRGNAAAEVKPEPAAPDTSAQDHAKAQLQELETLLLAKDQQLEAQSQELAAKAQELAAREEQIAAAEANLAARLVATSTGAGAAPAPPQPAEEKAPARSGKKQGAVQ